MCNEYRFVCRGGKKTLQLQFFCRRSHCVIKTIFFWWLKPYANENFSLKQQSIVRDLPANVRHEHERMSNYQTGSKTADL